MYKILEKQVLSEAIKLLVAEAPQVARKARAGQFVIVRTDEHGERIPLTIADYDRAAGTITLIFQEVGKSTMQMGLLKAGDAFATIAGPLGHPTEIENYGTVVCVGGGVGIAPLFPIARALKEAGNTVISIIGARNRSLLFWEERMRAVSDELHRLHRRRLLRAQGSGDRAAEGVAGRAARAASLASGPSGRRS